MGAEPWWYFVPYDADVEDGRVYIVLYAAGRPSKLCFAGYSFD